MGELGRKAKRSPSDLTDEERVRIEPLLPRPSLRGRKPTVDLAEVLNAIRYMAHRAGGWHMLPVHLGPWQTVHWWFRRFVQRLLCQKIHDAALMFDREAGGREASPGGGVLHSQAVKAPLAKERGSGGGKRLIGRKRHIAVDTDGRLLFGPEAATWSGFRTKSLVRVRANVLAQHPRPSWTTRTSRPAGCP